MPINAKALLLAGPIGAGKTTVAQYLGDRHSFEHLSFVDKIFVPILRNRHLAVTRSNLQDLGEELRHRHGLDGIGRMILPWVRDGGCYVIDDVRSAVVTSFLSTCIASVRVTFIKTSFDDRFPRLVLRDGVASRAEQKAAEERSTESSIGEIEAVADHILLNNGELPGLYRQVDAMIDSFAWQVVS